MSEETARITYAEHLHAAALPCQRPGCAARATWIVRVATRRESRPAELLCPAHYSLLLRRERVGLLAP